MTTVISNWINDNNNDDDDNNLCGALPLQSTNCMVGPREQISVESRFEKVNLK